MQNLIKVKVENKDNILVVDSRIVAKELGVRHDNLIAKIDEYAQKFTNTENLGFSINDFYIESSYKVEGNFKKYRMYWITEKGMQQLLGGYNSSVPIAFELNVAYINEFDRMKQYIKANNTVYMSEDMLLSKAVLVATKRIEALEQKILEDKPKIEYVDTVLKSESLLTTTIIAKDFGLSAKKLNEILSQGKIIYKQSGTWVLYSKYQDLGLAQTVTTEKTTKKRVQLTFHTLKWTEKGKKFIYNYLKKLGYKLAVEV